MKKASPQTGRVEVTSLHGLYMKTPPVVLLGGDFFAEQVAFYNIMVYFFLWNI